MTTFYLTNVFQIKTIPFVSMCVRGGYREGCGSKALDYHVKDTAKPNEILPPDLHLHTNAQTWYFLEFVSC